MRHIIKGHAPSVLSRQQPPQNSRRASERWAGYQQKHKNQIKNQCLDEQYHLCGYSELELTPPISCQFRDLGVHLEHIKPKHSFPSQTFNYNNLIACAIDDAKARNLVMKDVFGGHAKGSWYSEDFIDPLNSNCRDFFFYDMSSGKIVPNISKSRRDQGRARLTIHKLNLNSSVLIQFRKAWLIPLEKQIKGLLGDPTNLEKFCKKRMLPDQGRLKPFHSAMRQLFGKVGQTVCKQQNPPL